MIAYNLNLDSYSDDQILDFMFQGIISRDEYAQEYRRRMDERIRDQREDREGNKDSHVLEYADNDTVPYH